MGHVRRRRLLIAWLVSATMAVGCLAAIAPDGASAINQPTTVSSATDMATAAADAAAQGSRVEVTELDDEYSTTYANPDGSLTTDTSQAPIRTQQDGEWVPVDYTLEHVDGGWQPKASPEPVVFSNGGDNDAAQLGGDATELDQAWDVTLPSPDIDGATASYELGDGESLLLTATSTGFEQSLVLAHTPSMLPELKLPFDTSNLTMSEDATEGFLFKNTAGQVVYEMPTPFMYGATLDPDTGTPTEAQQVNANLVQTTDGARLDLAPSLAWLQAPTTTYPVTIDPTISAVSGGSDTYVEQGVTTRQDSDVMLRAGFYEADGEPTRGYLKFTGISMFSGDSISAASLTLYNNDANSCAAAQLNAYPVAQTWFDYNTVWSNKPTFTGSSAYSSSTTSVHGYGTGCPNATLTLNVKNMMAAWAGGVIPSYGIQLSGASESSSGQYWGFCSLNPSTGSNTSCSTASRSPQLSVTYAPAPDPVDSVSDAVSGGTANVDWIAPASGDATSYIVTSSPATAQSPQTVTSMNATFSGLASGTSYTFSVQACNGSGCAPAVTADQVPAIAPSAPQSVAMTDVANGGMTVTWDNPASCYDDQPNSVTGYKVLLTSNGTTISSMNVGPDTQSATLSGAQSGTTYIAQVSAQNSFGLGPNANSNSQIGMAPSQLNDLLATPGPGMITVSWSPPTVAATTFLIVATPVSGGSAIQQTASGSATSVSVGGLTNGQTYGVEIDATNSAGTTVNHARDQVAPQPLPSAPAAVSATGLGNGSLQVSWGSQGSNDDDYQINIINSAGTVVASTVAASDDASAVIDGLGTGTFTANVVGENSVGTSASAVSKSSTTIGSQDTDADDFTSDQITPSFVQTHAQLAVPSSEAAQYNASIADDSESKSAALPDYEPADSDDTSQDTSFDNTNDAAGSFSGCAASTRPNCSTTYYLAQSAGVIWSDGELNSMGTHERKMSSQTVMLGAQGFDCNDGADIGAIGKCVSWANIDKHVINFLSGWVSSRPSNAAPYTINLIVFPGNGGQELSSNMQTANAKNYIEALQSILVKYANDINAVSARCDGSTPNCRDAHIHIVAGIDEESGSGFNSAKYTLPWNQEINSLFANGSSNLFQWNNTAFFPQSCSSKSCFETQSSGGWSYSDMYQVVYGLPNAFGFPQIYGSTWPRYYEMINRYAKLENDRSPSYKGVLWQCRPTSSEVQTPGNSWDDFKHYTGQSVSFLTRQAAVGSDHC